MGIRRPTPAEMGLEVTIAIVTLSAPDEHFVCVSDRMISHDDILMGQDNAILKNFGLCKDWSVAYSANNIQNVFPLLNKVRNRLPDGPDTVSQGELKKYFTEAISETIQQEFFDRRLRRYGYGSLRKFIEEGRDHLGEHFFELCRELDQCDAGVDFIVYGYGEAQSTQLFEVTGKGEIKDHSAFRYAVIGSGYWMASASLKRKPLAFDFDAMAYRLLEAKFSSETASGVGKTTTVTVKRRNQQDIVIWPDVVEKIRAVWENSMRSPEPPQALELLGNWRMMVARSDEMRKKMGQAQ
jgi:hypothetical protein